MSDHTGRKFGGIAITQETIVFGIFLAVFTAFTLLTKGFLTLDNLTSLLQNVAVLGILSLAMGLVIIARGIDLAIVATMAISVAWTIAMINSGVELWLALLLGLGFAVAVGVIQGLLIAYIEIPAIFASLAMGIAVYGFGRITFVDQDIIHLAQADFPLKVLGSGRFLGIPLPVLLFGAIALILWLVLRFSKLGVFIRSIGDNPLRARIAGMPVRPLVILLYVTSAIIGFLAGILMAMLVGSMNTRIVNSTLIYDVILVVVLGGIGLSGGKGGVRNILVGTLLIGTILNGMTLLNVPYTVQNIIKGVILLLAICVDSFVNPRDEQTSQQGDI